MSTYTAHKYAFQPETTKAYARIPSGTIALQAHSTGVLEAEPIIVILDSLIRYAKAHEARFEGKLSEDYFLGPLFLKALTATRELLNGNGAVANEYESRGFACRDSKDNGACESMFWKAMEIGGFKEEDI